MGAAVTGLRHRVTHCDMQRPRTTHAAYHVLTLAFSTITGCATAPDAVLKSTQLHKLKGRADAYAISHDARSRSTYFVRQDEAALLKFCAEPPPDVAANLQATREVDASVDAALKYAAIDAAINGSGSSKTSASSEIADAATRTELVLFMRDALYRICELHANGETAPGQAAKMFGDLLVTAGTMSQRDNVGKLIEAVTVVLEKAPQSESAIDDLLTTVQLLAVSNLNGGLDPALRAAMTSKLMGKIADVATKQEAVDTVVKAHTDELKTLRSELAALRVQEAAAKGKEKKGLTGSVTEKQEEINEIEHELRILGVKPADLGDAGAKP